MAQMKPQYLRLPALAGLLYFFMFSSNAIAGNYDECEYKRRNLEHQLEYAQAYNNIHRMRGLQRALRNLDEHCTYSRVQEFQKSKIAEKQQKVTKRQYELEQARMSGRREKIADRQAKLAEAEEELAEARQELSRRTVFN